MMSPELLRLHWDYTIWATDRLLEASGKLSTEEVSRDFGTADRGVLGSLQHVFRSDRLWLPRLQKLPFLPQIVEEQPPLADLQTKWPESHAEWKQYLSAVTN